VLSPRHDAVPARPGYLVPGRAALGRIVLDRAALGRIVLDRAALDRIVPAGLRYVAPC